MKASMIALALAGALVSSAAAAADISRPAPYKSEVFSSRWAGFNVGIYGSMGSMSTKGTDEFFGVIDARTSAQTSGFSGGITAGYLWQYGRFVFGPQLEYGIGSFETAATDTFGLTLTAQQKWQAALVSKLGWDMGSFMPYLIGGVALAKHDYCMGIGTFYQECWEKSQYAPTLGVGLAMELSRGVTASLEFRDTLYPKSTYYSSTLDTTASQQMDLKEVRAGLSYRF